MTVTAACLIVVLLCQIVEDEVVMVYVAKQINLLRSTSGSQFMEVILP